MFDIRIPFVNDVFGQMPFGFSGGKDRPRVDADFLVLEMFFAKEPYFTRRIPARVLDPRLADIRFNRNREATVQRAG